MMKPCNDDLNILAFESEQLLKHVDEIPQRIELIIEQCNNDPRNLLQMFNDDLITFEEMRAVQYQMQKQQMLPRLLEYKNNKQWREFCTFATCVYEVMPEAFVFYNEVPDNLKYQFALDCYTNHGDSLPTVRNAIQGLRKYGKPTLPPEIATQDVITVYRAGEESIDKCKYRISWTLDESIAHWFFAEYIGRHAKHIYKAKIKTCDIIAYTDDRNEKEVLQYIKVFDIEEITNNAP